LAEYARVATVVRVGGAPFVDAGAGPDPAARTGIDAEDLRGRLAELGLRGVLCEGGPTLFSALLEQDALDEWCVSLSHLAVAGPGPRPAHSATASPRDFIRTTTLEGSGAMFFRWSRPA
ncbi:MAG: hypothetical protein ACTH31_11345, partial [Pseudoclavibacter sp.]